MVNFTSWSIILFSFNPNSAWAMGKFEKVQVDEWTGTKWERD